MRLCTVIILLSDGHSFFHGFIFFVFFFVCFLYYFFFFQAEDGIRYLVRSRGLGDVYKRQSNVDPVCLGSSVTLASNDLELLSAHVSKIITLLSLPSAKCPQQDDDFSNVRESAVPKRSIEVFSVSYTHLTLPTSDLV